MMATIEDMLGIMDAMADTKRLQFRVLVGNQHAM
jgi:hypothetical protein